MQLLINQLKSNISEGEEALKNSKMMDKKEVSYWKKQINDSRKKLKIYL